MYISVLFFVLFVVEASVSFHTFKSSLIARKNTKMSAVVASCDAVSPDWFNSMKTKSNVKLAVVQEWQDEQWRTNEGGFLGRDFCHSKEASVRILDYLIVAPSQASSDDIVPNETQFPKLIGPAYFSPKSESHKGLCHGGTFCALMDDVIGWMGFCVTGEVKPWCGFTVQINTSLKKAVKVGSTLKLEAWVDRKEGLRKYWINGRLTDEETGDVHCEGEGLFLLNPDEVTKVNQVV